MPTDELQGLLHAEQLEQRNMCMSEHNLPSTLVAFVRRCNVHMPDNMSDLLSIHGGFHPLSQGVIRQGAYLGV